jgi:hypothetical protein
MSFDNNVHYGMLGPSKLRVSFDGSLYLVRPVGEEAREWLNENIAEDAAYFGGALAVEPRYIEALLEGAQYDGIEVVNE